MYFLLDAGQVSFPGGKADCLKETPFQTARREAFEEIGLPSDDRKLPKPFQVEHLCELPTNLAVTEMGVRPCVAYLHAGESSDANQSDVEETLMPKLNAQEVAAVFSAPFHKFLEEDPGWYEGSWRTWHDVRWRMHNFYVPVEGQVSEDSGQSYRIWGMTARIVVDAARLAFAEDPPFEHNDYVGDEAMIRRLYEMGKLRDAKQSGHQLSREELMKAAKMAKM